MGLRRAPARWAKARQIRALDAERCCHFGLFQPWRVLEGTKTLYCAGAGRASAKAAMISSNAAAPAQCVADNAADRYRRPTESPGASLLSASLHGERIRVTDER
jgi:hypothetical protein